MGSVDDISQLCRLCLVKDKVNVPIFEETSDIGQTSEKINSCLPVKVSPDDNLPKKICDGCSYKLDMLYIFRNTSIASEKQLISWLDQIGLSTISQTSAKDPLANTKPEVMVKQETFDSTDSRADGDNSDIGTDTHTYILQQQQLPYQQEFGFGEPSSSVEMTDEPAPKRAKRAAALKKAPIDETDDGDDDDDLDAAMQITKAEEEDSDDVDQPDYVEALTSADDQPGPSGVGKAAAEAPLVSNPPEKTCSCTKCNIKFENYKLLKKHRHDVHTPERYECSTCGKRFKERYRLKQHTEIHSDVNPYYCDFCDEYVKTYQQLANHKKKHTTPSPGHVCPECGRHFRSTSSYTEHLGTHRGVQYSCYICQQTFRSRFILKCHKRTHNVDYQETKAKCDECNKIFKSENSLRKHVKRLHNGERHLCEICGKALMSAASLRDHTLIHTGEKPYACTYCDKRFAKKQHLQDHERVHTKEKPHACPFCEKKYSQRTPLTLHIRRVHNDEKPFSCIACSKRFVSNAMLQSHVRTHPTKNV